VLEGNLVVLPPVRNNCIFRDRVIGKFFELYTCRVKKAHSDESTYVECKSCGVGWKLRERRLW